MKKFKHIWIFSDSIMGHEIQSIALASKLADKIELFHCTLRQPWLSFAPRILPRFGKNIIWKQIQPNTSQGPDAIITCGRRMAAVGKFFKRKIGCRQIQILNPGDNHTNYDVLICPEHDRLKGNNVINSKGSLHNISPESLEKIKCQEAFEIDKKIVCLILGNPAQGFFKELDELAIQISHFFPQYQLMICGSRRTPRKYYSTINKAFPKARAVWLTEKNGDNPYQALLACSHSLLVTADSINMVSEACATSRCVIAIGQNYISPKHQRFIASIKNRLSDFDDLKEKNVPLNTLNNVVKKMETLI